MQCKHALTVKFIQLLSKIIMYLIFFYFFKCVNIYFSCKHLDKKHTKQTANHTSSTAGICARTSRVQKPCFYNQTWKKNKFQNHSFYWKKKLPNATLVIRRNVRCTLQLFFHGTHGQWGSFTSQPRFFLVLTPYYTFLCMPIMLL
jgi:hypothetical protein